MTEFSNVINIVVDQDYQGTQIETSIISALRQFEQTVDGQILISALQSSYGFDRLEFQIGESDSRSHFDTRGDNDYSNDHLQIDPRDFTQVKGHFEKAGFWDFLTAAHAQPFSIQRVVFHELYHAAAGHLEKNGGAEIRAIQATNLFLEKYYGIERFRDEYGHGQKYPGGHDMVDLTDLFNSEGYHQIDIELGERLGSDHSRLRSGDVNLLRLFDFFENEQCFLAGTMIYMWGGGKKAIEDIRPEDWVVSRNEAGETVRGRVTRTFSNEARVILDFHGTFVTPGHVYFRPDGKRPGKFEPLIDILRDDGVIQHEDGTQIRANTGCEVGSKDDQEFWAYLIEQSNGVERVRGKKKLRLGTRWMLPDGRHFSIREYMEAIGCELILEGPKKGYVHHKENGLITLFAWVLSDKLPEPEDFILARSGTSLEEIYRAGEWEGMRPRLSTPMRLDGGPVHAATGLESQLLHRNAPIAMRPPKTSLH